ncbi:hypothetical protein [Pseudogemmobacter bohemicus]|uniref:hypothetical protein n=1 Tax=Pseudogemmobacter bohemicus TaxID=2250708 RepID=UPI000DD3C053|nr:hypothetical protein [Pseudogemmobacter bohemicus]
MASELRDTDGFSELKKVLADFPLRNGEQEFACVAAAFLRRHGDRFRLLAVPEPLSGAEAEALRSVGVAPNLGSAEAAPLLQSKANHAALVVTALPIAEVAGRLGVTEAHLRRRIGERTLLAVRGPDGRGLRVPAFQLTGTGELPGLRVVLRAIRPGLRPLQVTAFFATPQPDLEDAQGKPMAPVTWLLAGHDPESVRDLARDL